MSDWQTESLKRQKRDAEQVQEVPDEKETAKADNPQERDGKSSDRAPTSERRTHLSTTTNDLEKWPEVPDGHAYWGLAGKIIERIEPHSEADPVALLITLLIGFGNVIGRTAYFLAEATKHYLNLFAVLVGTTSKGRKGSSLGQIKRLFAQVDEQWANTRVMGGLSSGEGFISAVRDPVEKASLADPGELDKRLLVTEEEFCSVLMVAAREKNTLSPRIREAWDSGNLATLTKNPMRATGAHVSIIGHATKQELLRTLNTTEQSNGFGNRFLWLCTRRSKCLPEGGQIHKVDFSDLVTELQQAVDFAKRVEHMERDDKARAFWARIYPALSEGKPGLTGAMLGRAEAQVMRLACIYALLDRSWQVKLDHLQAGLAVWDYCERSTRFIFGSSTGNRMADEILAALKSAPDGLTRTTINYEIFNRNKSKLDIDAALNVLREHGLAHHREETTTERNIVERWFAGLASTISTI